MSFLSELNSVQREAVTAVDGPVMIIAGAGSGKTRVLTYRAAYLIDRGIRPESILALTFTNKAAEEMKGRITSLLDGVTRVVWMGTFHSMFARLLRRECEHIGYRRSFTIYDTDDTLALIKGIMNSLGVLQQQYSPQGIRSRISNAKNQMISPKAYKQSASDPVAERTSLVYEEYEKRLKQYNAMDFDDLLLKPIELFARKPEILERYHYHFKYILVDEYQDTNRVQYRLIRELGKRDRNICVVGDDAQSIYAFRGADIRNILDFEKDYPDCRIFRLEQNYRSTKTILAAADSIIKHNVGQIQKDLWTENIDGEPITLTVCDDDRDEGHRVVSAIQEESNRKKLDLKDFAVLYRTNAQSRSFEDALRRNGIPYRIVGGVAFYKRKEIKDVLAYLNVIANPYDEESLLRVINVPPRSIGEITLKKVKEFAAERSIPLLDALGSPGLPSSIADRTLCSIKDFHLMVRKYIRLKQEMSVSELARSLVDEIGILHALKEENTAESLSRRENVIELVSALSEFQETHPAAGLADFLEEVSLVTDFDMTDFGRNAVTLMTLHAAKGLEFAVVFITGIEEGLLPLTDSENDQGELEEERRLLYVGITRAMKKLYLSYALTRLRFGEFTYSVKSRFLDEIDGSRIIISDAHARKSSGVPRRTAPGVILSWAEQQARRKKPAQDIEQYFSDTLPNYEDESQLPFSARVGSQVVHDIFGKGKVIAIDGHGENARAVVDFTSVGRKHLLLKFANLRSI